MQLENSCSYFLVISISSLMFVFPCSRIGRLCGTGSFAIWLRCSPYSFASSSPEPGEVGHPGPCPPRRHSMVISHHWRSRKRVCTQRVALTALAPFSVALSWSLHVHFSKLGPVGGPCVWAAASECICELAKTATNRR